jgi:hypothetical protein
VNHDPTNQSGPLSLRRRQLKPAGLFLALCAASGLGLTGCTSLISEGASTISGVAGSGIAGAVTSNAAVASGIGLGVLAATDAGVKALERDYHGDQQDRIAEVAGALKVGKVGHWESRHRIQVEADEVGRVTVSRLIGAADLSCKEIVFTVERIKDKETVSAFYVATICKDATKWRWASAEPATARWGSLQ